MDPDEYRFIHELFWPMMPSTHKNIRGHTRIIETEMSQIKLNYARAVKNVMLSP